MKERKKMIVGIGTCFGHVECKGRADWVKRVLTIFEDRLEGCLSKIW